jgi:copper chaperone
MQTLQFKTTLKCGGCVATITPVLDNMQAVKSWQVDTDSVDKILTVQTDGDLTADDVIDALNANGYAAQEI